MGVGVGMGVWVCVGSCGWVGRCSAVGMGVWVCVGGCGWVGG